MFQKISPSQLILLDAVGATISGLLWWLLIGTNPDLFGIAAPIPWLLGGFALLFSWLGWFHEYLNLSAKQPCSHSFYSIRHFVSAHCC